MGNRSRLVILVLLVAAIVIVGLMLASRGTSAKTLSGQFGVAYSGYETIPLLVGLNDASGYFIGNPIYLMPKEKQVLGKYSGNASSGSYTLDLPDNPNGQPFDLAGGKNPTSKVEIFEVRLMSDVANKGSMSPNEDSIASSLKISVDEKVQGGMMLVWAADAQEQFPGDYGADKQLFTADDPHVPLPAGWSLVNLDSSPFAVTQFDNKSLDLITTGVGDVVDYTQLSCAKLIPALLDWVQQNYPFTELHHIDWDSLRAKLLPESKSAASDTDCQRIIREFANAIPDGHVVFSLPALRRELAGNAGLRLDSTSAGQVVVIGLSKGGPADKAGIKLGGIVTQGGSKPVAQAIKERDLQTGNSSTDFRLRYLKLRLLPYGMQNSSVQVSFQNPGGTSQTVTLTRLTNQSVAGVAVKSPSIRDDKLDSGIGYLRINDFIDITSLTDFDSALDKLIKGNVQGLILDVRSNPGGLSQMGDAMASRFFDKSFVVGKDYAPDGRFLYEMMVDPRTPIYKGCVAVLVDLNTASTGDLFAYTFKSTKRGIIVGHTPSSGMAGAVSGGEYELPGNAHIQVPTSDFVDDSGKIIIEGQGAVPDVTVPVTVDSLLSSE